MFRGLHRTILALSVAAAGLTLVNTAQAQPPPPPGAGGPGAFPGYVDLSVFYETLAPYGEWIFLPPYGWVWSPYNVTPEWRPYYYGYWVWTECGWTWVSTEPFGWAVYHYGRWLYQPFYGWVWVPGHIWGPAWVAWRRGDGWLGWAALPPDPAGPAPVGPGGVNINIHVNIINSIRRFSWNFVEEDRFCERNLKRYIVKPVRNVHIVNQTQNITNYSVQNNTVINKSLSFQQSQSKWGKAIPSFRIQDADRKTLSAITGNTLQLFRPKIESATPKITPDKIAPPRPAPTDPAGDWAKRRAQEQEALQKRFAELRAQLEDRQKREMERAMSKKLGKGGISVDELRKRHAMERAALEEQIDRETKLVNRYDERLQKGQAGSTTATGSKYLIKPNN